MMKKAVLCSLVFVMIVLLTGCSKTQKLHCTKTETSSENLELKESLNITFKGNEVTYMSIYSEIEISGSYTNYIDEFSKTWREQYANLEGKKGIEYHTTSTDHVLSVIINANLKKMDKDAKKELSIGSVRQSLKDAKIELETSGYTCE